MKKTNLKKGISLIVLIITIVVIIILAVTVVLTLNKNNPINSAKDASSKAQVATYRDSVKLAKMEIIAKNEGDYDILNDKIIQDGLGLKDEFKNALLVRNGELVYDINSDIKQQKLFESIDVKCEYPTPIGGSLHTEVLNGKIVKVAPVPEGFEVSTYTNPNTNENETKIDDGLVIKQKGDTPNEFVWVPVPNPETDYKRGVATLGVGAYLIENDSDPINKAIKDSVFKYHGFYIGRYETGVDDMAENARFDVGGTTWCKNAKPVSIRGVRPWNMISQTKAVEVSKNIVNTASAKSTLINSYVWDTTLNYINKVASKNVTTDSTSWGNYRNADFPFTNASYSKNWIDYTKVTESTNKPTNTGWILTTGATNKNAAKNIHDLAGNLWEWTTENANGGSGSVCIRGGYCGYGGNSFPAASRNSTDVAGLGGSVGFRVVLYLL